MEEVYNYPTKMLINIEKYNIITNVKKVKNMEYRYKPEGVCSKEMIVEIENDIIKSVKIIGGCPGNTVGVSTMVEGRKIDEVIKKLKGIPCGFKGTSCPDQLAKALEEIKEKITK